MTTEFDITALTIVSAEAS